MSNSQENRPLMSQRNPESGDSRNDPSQPTNVPQELPSYSTLRNLAYQAENDDDDDDETIEDDGGLHVSGHHIDDSHQLTT